MSDKHRDPEYVANARIVRQQVARARRAGHDIGCWRCGFPIDPEQRWDVGHIDPDGGNSLANLAPEHRYKTPYCIGNRAAGGKLGAARRRTTGTAGLTSKTPPPRVVTTSTDLLPWLTK